MSYRVFTIPPYDKELKRLSKKYHSLKNEYAGLIESLEQNPQQGTPIGNNCYKIRLAIASKAKGKSGGARVITHIQVTKTSVYLLSIYDKSEKENIAVEELKALLQYIIK